MKFRILGPLDAIQDGRALELGGAKQRALLAVLLLQANRVVSVDSLIEALWEEQQPETARGKNVSCDVSALNGDSSFARLRRRSLPAFVEDELDVRAVGVEHEGAEVPGVVRGPLAWLAVRAVPGLDGCTMECVDSRAIARREREMHILGRLACDDRERAFVAENLRPPGVDGLHAQPGRRRDRPVEARGRLDIGDA